MRSSSAKFMLSLLLAVTILVSLTGSALAEKPATVAVQILAVNDFHGALDFTAAKPNAVPPVPQIGGAEYLATYVKNLSAQNPNTIKVSAGDMIGASPLLSALFHDEPTIMAFNLMGFDFSAVGNHEFDEGWQELLRMQNGGCHAADGCYAGVPTFTGASFKYLTGNVVQLENGQTLFSGYSIKAIGGVKVAFIGISLEGTPTIVVPSGVAGLQFNPEVPAINSLVKQIKDSDGVKTIVVLLHDGGSLVSATNPNLCNPADPFLTSVVMNLDPEVDALITGHSHNAYNCKVQIKKNYAPVLVTSAGSSGKYLTDIDLLINATNGQVTESTGSNILVDDTNITPDPEMKALLDQYRVTAGPIANQIIGSITADIKRNSNSMAESALGDVIADGQLAATSAPENGGAVVAMTNPGGIRNELFFTQSVGEGNGNVTYGEAFAVQPFSNSLVTMTLTGDQLKAVLEQQATALRRLQISASLTYTWTNSAPAGSKVSELKINGVAVDPAASYRVTVNNFLAGGGDGFTELTKGTDLLTGMIDLDAFVAYIKANSPVAPGPMNRITILP